jgi:NADH dehydrogenase/NADH:ubiquinone oxidoreductase subunit G
MSGESVFTIEINGRAVDVGPGMTVFEAAESAGIEIPHLCHYSLLEPTGACRLCVVEVEGARALQASCTTPVRPNMKVRTETERVVEARKTIIELLLANHPQDCLTCERAGNCDLQDYAYMYGIRESRYHGQTKDYAPDTSNPFFERDHKKCIMCGRCIRICDEVMGANAIDYAHRGFATKVATPYDEGLENTTCVFCGNCVAVCPVGALIPKSEKGIGRIWQTKVVRTVCTYCGVGCQINLRVRNGKGGGRGDRPSSLP